MLKSEQYTDLNSSTAFTPPACAISIIITVKVYEAVWACVSVCVCVRVCVCVCVCSQMTTKQNTELQKSKDLQPRHGLSGDMSHTGTLNIAVSLQCACLCLGLSDCVHVGACMLSSACTSVIWVNVCALNRDIVLSFILYPQGVFPCTQTLVMSRWPQQRQCCSGLICSAQDRDA